MDMLSVKELSCAEKVLMTLKGRAVCPFLLGSGRVSGGEIANKSKILFVNCIQKIELVDHFTASNLSTHMWWSLLRVFSSTEGPC